MSPPRVRIRRVEGPPVVSIRVWIPGGSRVERTPGEALMSGRLLGEGTHRRDWRRIHQEAEDRGWSVTASAGYEAQGISLDGLADGWETALGWAAELISEPEFPRARLDWLREQSRTELLSLADQPDAIAEWGFRRQLYGGHPRGRPLQGALGTLDRLQVEACREFHRRCLGQGAIVAVAGAVDEQAVRDRVEELFAAHPERPRTTEPDNGEDRAGHGDRRDVRLPPGSGQAHLHLGGVTVTRAAEEIPALAVLSVVLGAGGGLAGRIPARVRESEGLAYACDVSATRGAGLDPGFSQIHVATAVERVEDAERAVKEELDRLVESGIEQAELKEARSYLLGREPFRRETARQWSAILAEAELLGLPLDRPEIGRERLRRVERSEVEAAARRFLAPATLKKTVASPAMADGARGASPAA